MNLATIILNGHAQEALIGGDGAVPLHRVFPDDTPDLLTVIGRYSPDDLRRRCADLRSGWQPTDDARYMAPFTNARKIIGIGLNFPDHTSDLAAGRPEEPTFFLKADHTVIGPGADIPLPSQSERVTSEAELGVVIGRKAHRVPPEEALSYVWGVVPVLDQTAEDILQRNTRFLMRAKNFPGFFSFGPQIMPIDELLAVFGSIEEVAVSTIHNGEVHRTAKLGDAFFSVPYLISFLSHVMPLFPGDVVSTGTPGAVALQPGDSVTCRIPGVGELRNMVATEACHGKDESL